MADLQPAALEYRLALQIEITGVVVRLAGMGSVPSQSTSSCGTG